MNETSKRGGVLGAATVFSDFASVLGARLTSALLSVLSVLVTTRILEPAAYGTVAYVAVVGLLIFTVSSAWTSTAVSRYGREEIEERGSMTAVTWNRIVLTAPLLLLGAVIVVVVKLAGGFPSDFSWALTWLSIAYGVVLVTADHVLYTLEAAGRMKLSAAGLLGQQLAVMIALAAILISGVGGTPVVIASISVAAAALFTAGFGFAVARVALWPPRLDEPLRRRMLALSLPLIAFTVSQYVVRSVDLIVIGAFAGATALGVYAVAYQAYSVLQQFTTASGPVLTPLFVSLRRAGREEIVARYTERVVPQLTFLASIVVGLAVPLVSFAVPIVFGEPFEDAAGPLAVLLFALVLLFVANLLAPVLVLHERGKAIGALNVVAAIVNIVGDVLLVGVADLEVLGPAIATTVAVAVIAIGYLVVGRDCTGTGARFPAAELAPFLAGFIPAVTLPVAIGIPVAVVAVAVVSAIVLYGARPFVASDAELISGLDMPAPMKRAALRAVELAAR